MSRILKVGEDLLVCILHDPGVMQYTHEEIVRAILGTLLQGIKPG